MPGASIVVQLAQQAIAVEGQDAKQDEEHHPWAPAQKGHDQEGVPQDEGIVQSSNQVCANLPWRVCMRQQVMSCQIHMSVMHISQW